VSALTSGSVRLGWEQADNNPTDHRAVVQFPVGGKVFDTFFNGRAGYRAHFWVSPDDGLSFNDEIVELVNLKLSQRLPPKLPVCELVPGFQGVGMVEVSARLFLDSLTSERSLAKVWFCRKRIGHECVVEDLMVGLSGPRIRLSDGRTWAAPYAEDDDCWLDVKGAFLGRSGPYQPKDPVNRARGLNSTGTA
jgi:hypothetical protein